MYSSIYLSFSLVSSISVVVCWLDIFLKTITKIIKFEIEKTK